LFLYSKPLKLVAMLRHKFVLQVSRNAIDPVD